MRTALRGCFAALVLLLVLAAPASATIRYAVPSGGSTDDSACTIANCEIHHAVAIAQAGDTVQLAAGTYDIPNDNRLNVNAAITIAGDPSGARPTISASNDAPVIFHVAGITVRYATLEARDAGHAVFGVYYPGPTLDRVVARSPDGLLWGAGGAILNSVVTASSGAALAVAAYQESYDDAAPAPAAVDIRNSTFRANTALQVEAQCIASPTTTIFLDSNVRARNTIFDGNINLPHGDSDCPSQYGANLDVAYTYLIADSLIMDSPQTHYHEGGGMIINGHALHLVAQDGGYRETSSSPTVDAGDDAEAPGTDDFFGNARTGGSAVDIGAGEFVPGPAAFDVSSPGDGATAWSAPPTLEWESSSGADHYDLYVDGSLYRAGITGTSATLADDLADGQHSWKVVAVNAAGGQTDSTSTRNLTIDLDPPGAFTLAGPDDGAIFGTVPPSLDWNASPGADHYDLYIDGKVDRSDLHTAPWNPAEQLSDGNHTWYVAAIDSHGRETDSATRTLTIDTTPPGSFDLSTPGFGEYATTSSPTFSWTAASSADHYDLWIDGQRDRAGVSGTSTTPSTPLSDGPHNFLVVAYDAVGNSVASAHGWGFFVDTTPPGQFDLSGPADSVVTNHPVLSWGAASDVDHYDLVVDGSTYASGLTTTSSTPSGLVDGEHTWKIVAVDAAGNTTDSATRTFTLDRTPPGAFASVAPADFALLDTAQPSLSWSAASGVDHYDLVIDNDIVRAGITTTSATPPTALADGRHTWDVRAVDAAGNVRESDQQRFTVDTTAPAAFDLSSPADDVALADTKPTLQWASSAGTDSYDLVIDGNVVRTGLTDPSAAPPTPLAEGDHTWKVVAHDAAGHVTDSTSTRKFTVDVTPPGTFDLGSPADGARVTDASPALSWSAAGGAVSYTLLIDGKTDAAGIAATSSKPSKALADGAHTWKVIARDTAGNTTASSSARAFTVDTAVPPTGDSTGPAGGGSQPQTPQTETPQTQTETPQSQPPAPITAASFSILSRKASRSGAVTYKVKVSGAGALSANAKPVGKTWTAARGTAKAKGPGTVTLALKPTSKARRGARTLKVVVMVTFKPASGNAVTKRVKLTLKLPRP